MFRISIKQFLRSPVLAALFVILFALTAFIMCSGAALWARNQAAVKAYEDAFITIGTVRQKPTSMAMWERWDAWEKAYTSYSGASYSPQIPATALDFEGADYIHEPEKRPVYGSLADGLATLPDLSGTMVTTAESHVVLFTPLTEGILEQPIEVKLEKVISNRPSELGWSLLPDEGQTLLICDHYNDSPEAISIGKTYIAHITPGSVHNPNNLGQEQMEWVLGRMNATFTVSAQCTPDGGLIGSGISLPYIQEIGTDFFETETGSLWLEYAASLYNCYRTIPVLPTNATDLLLPFHNYMAYIVEGSDITAKEYADGEKVCIISSNFARMNGLAPGDTIRLQLYFANYGYTPSELFWEPDYDAIMNGGISYGFGWSIGAPLNASGQPYPVFSDHEYVIKGIYGGSTNTDAAFALGANTVIIPSASVEESDSGNIIDSGRMRDETTSFQIPNGAIEVYMERWLSQGHDELEITFYDRGYTQLQRGLDNIRRASTLLMAIGIAMAIALVFFFCHVFVAKNKTRTAIERTLGYTNMQCITSLLLCFILAAAVSVIVGVFVGIRFEGTIANGLLNEGYYDTTYTAGVMGQEIEGLDAQTASPLLPFAIGFSMLLATFIASVCYMLSNLRKEPLKMLGSR